MHAFISHVNENKEQVTRLAKYLRDHGVEVWLDRDSIRPGELWSVAIKNAIQSGDFFIACFSADYWKRDKTYMNEELNIAIGELRLRPYNISWFIPILLSECEVPDIQIRPGESLRDIQWISLCNDYDTAVKRILDVISPISDAATVKRLLDDVTSCDHDLVPLALTKLKKMTDFLHNRILQDLAEIIVSNKTDTWTVDTITSQIIDRKDELTQMVANLIIANNSVLNEKALTSLARMISPKSISFLFPEIVARCVDSSLPFQIDKLSRPYYAWSIQQGVFERIKLLWFSRNGTLIGLQEVLDSIWVCNRCKQREVIRISNEQIQVDTELYEYETECAFCGNRYVPEEFPSRH